MIGSIHLQKTLSLGRKAFGERIPILLKDEIAQINMKFSIIMEFLNSTNFSVTIKNSFITAVGIGFALVMIGWILVPATSILSIVSALMILITYSVFGYFGTPRLARTNPDILHWAGVFGLFAGVIFISEILWEYITLPTDNTRLGLIEFGSVFSLYFLSGLVVVYRTHQLRQAIFTAIGSAMIGSLIWLIAVLTIFYLFRGSPQQVQVFRAEGNFEDFARSGMSDFNTFIMEDFMGAGFFHLLLGPVVATILGTFGGLLGKGLARFSA